MKIGQPTRVQDSTDQHVYVNVWVECRCGHHFWWDTHCYGSNITCSECDKKYYATINLVESWDE